MIPGMGGGPIEATAVTNATPQIEDARVIIESISSQPIPPENKVDTAMAPYKKAVQASLIMPPDHMI